MIPFSEPALFQVREIQAALAPVRSQFLETAAATGAALQEANRSLSSESLDKSAFITRVVGEPGYLFRYKSDPAGFARLILKPSDPVGSDFEICRMWAGRWPSVIALHSAGWLTCVKTRLFINMRDLILPAGLGGEYMEVKDLKRNSPAANLIGNLFWAGLGVFPK